MGIKAAGRVLDSAPMVGGHRGPPSAPYRAGTRDKLRVRDSVGTTRTIRRSSAMGPERILSVRVER